jgi:hypothetical protein
VLWFDSGPDGYKMRCTSCGAVVRLRADAESGRSQKRKESGVLAFQQPAPSASDAHSSDTRPVLPEQYDYDALHPGELPVVELVPLSELAPTPTSSFWRRRWLPLTAVLVVTAAAIVLFFMLRA